MYPLLSERTADAIPAAVACRGLEMARRPLCRWLACPITDTAFEQAYVANTLSDAHRADPEFGYRFPTGQARDAGFSACGRTMWRKCSSNGWWSSFGKKGKKPGPPVHDDLVNRDFTANASHQLWLTKITEPWTGESKLCLCAIKDVFSS